MNTKQKGFTLIEWLVALCVLLIILSASSIVNVHFGHSLKKLKLKQKQFIYVQNTLETLRATTFEQINTKKTQGISVTKINPNLKEIQVSSGNITFTTRRSNF